MKLFERSGGHWLFWSGFLYLSLTVLVGFSPYRDYTMLVQSVWLIMIALPLLCNPLARWLNMKETNMFDFFRRKTAKEYMDEASNVYNLPKPKAVEPPAPEPKKEEPAKIYYRLGLTDNNRIAFSMGYSEITMNHSGCQQMIDQLKFFQSQLTEEFDNSPDDDPDGGEPVPVPVPEQKAA